MKILQVNKFYYPKRGADKYFLFISELLRENGHELRSFAMSSAKNLASPDAKYFSKEMDLEDLSLKNIIQTAPKMIYNFEAKAQFTKLIQDFEPDIIHCHNIYHQLSPSILDAARKAKIPVVMHLHDYKLICPNYRMFNKGEVCRKCKPKKYFTCFFTRCFDSSLAKSFLASLEMTIHHKFLKIYKKGIIKFIAPSKFMRDICIDFAWPKEKFEVLENISPIADEVWEGELKDYYLYFGALEIEKGIDLILKAMQGTKLKLKIAGAGKEEINLKKLAQSLKLDVEFLGFQAGDNLKKLIDEAKAIIIPSRWYENMPLSALEAISRRKTVVAADIGGLSELIEHAKDGYLFKANDFKALAEILKSLDTNKAKSLGEAAFIKRKDKTKEWHYEELMRIYQEAILEYKKEN